MKAALDAKRMQPNVAVTAVVKHNALKGMLEVLCTFAKNLLPGNPPSLAKANTILLLVVKMLTVPSSCTNH